MSEDLIAKCKTACAELQAQYGGDYVALRCGDKIIVADLTRWFVDGRPVSAADLAPYERVPT